MLKQLIKISRYYGKQAGYALGGGGNTSFKNESHLWVKASGYSLADISEDGFAILNRKALNQISKKVYSDDPFERERQVKDDLLAANALPGNIRRPSVEASLHDIIDHAFVVHTHPYVVNALLCSMKAKAISMKLFPKAIFVPYTDPGYILFKKIESVLSKYRSKYQVHPNIVFLQNHGVFVAAGTTHEIKIIYDEIFKKIKQHLKSDLTTGKKSFRYSALHEIKKSYNKLEPGSELVFKTRQNSLIDFYIANRKKPALVKKPFIPDQIVYCKTHPLWLSLADKKSASKIEKRITHYHNLYGYLPRVILAEKEGMIGAEINDQSANLVLDVFEDAMKISYYSLNFGGPHFMTRRQIKFIESWEVENYRRNLLVK